MEFKELLPGDLMFWTGTYETGRDIPISHVMLYLGREKGRGKRIMFGASDGRSYNGIQRWGVSVFDFKMPQSLTTRPIRKRSKRNLSVSPAFPGAAFGGPVAGGGGTANTGGGKKGKVAATGRKESLKDADSTDDPSKKATPKPGKKKKKRRSDSD